MKEGKHELYVRVLTPLHIGGEQEKHLERGIDYEIEGGKVLRYVQQRLVERLGINTYVDALEGGKDKLRATLEVRKVPLPQVTEDWGPIEGSCDTIRMMVRDGMHGRPYLPGSSLKGGLRSALFAAFGGKKEKKDKSVFGEFNDSVMRFIKVGDVHFPTRGDIVNTKIMSPQPAGGHWIEGWKHQSSGSHEFDNYRFTTGLQVVPIGTLAKVSFTIDQEGLERYRSNRKSNLPVAATSYLSTKNLQQLLFGISTYTSLYLEREVEYFTSIDGFKSGGEIVGPYQSLQQQNTPTAPLLRVGFGSGYHSVTGDYFYPDHLTPLYKELHGKKKKTRRIAFTYDKVNDRTHFYPLGFIQLLTPEAAQPFITRQREQSAQKVRVVVPPPPASAAQTEAPPAAKREEQRSDLIPKAIAVSDKKLKKGVTVACTVVRNEGKHIVVTPLIEGYEQAEVYFRYALPLGPGTLVNGSIKKEGKKLVGVGAPKLK